MDSKKGQAASEYLMTYGWALLMLVAVIALILATGAFNPSYFISEECVIQPDITCGGYQLYRDGGTGDTTLLLMVENRLGYRMRLDEVSITTMDVGRAGEYTWTEPVGKELGQGGNATVEFKFDGSEQPPVGSVERMRVTLKYDSCAREVNDACEEGAAPHVVVGRITARVSKPG